MTSLFVDTSALIALGNSRDQFHAQARTLFKEYISSHTRFMTTNAVLLELTNAFSAARYKALGSRLLHLILDSNEWTVRMIDEALMKQGIDRFEQFRDKDWSLVDCISMCIAHDSGITDIFTTDHHFEQAGFIILLK